MRHNKLVIAAVAACIVLSAATIDAQSWKRGLGIEAGRGASDASKQAQYYAPVGRRAGAGVARGKGAKENVRSAVFGRHRCQPSALPPSS